MKKILSLVALGLASCATITGPSSYNVTIQGEPGSKVQVGGFEQSLPSQVQLKPKSSQTIMITKECYLPANMVIDGQFRVAATVFGNFFWLIPGLAVDLGTQNAWSYDPVAYAPKLNPDYNSQNPACKKLFATLK